MKMPLANSTNVSDWDGTGFTDHHEPTPLVDRITSYPQSERKHVVNLKPSDVEDWELKSRNNSASKDFTKEVGIHQIPDSKSFAEKHNLKPYKGPRESTGESHAAPSTKK